MDGGDGTADHVINKRFVSESELDERRKRRQEEWEKVRKPEDPEECPEEVYDPRSLYERLQEQKDKKQQEFEEQFKFKNMVRGLDEDETKFLDEVSRQQALIEKQRREDDLKELNEYRSTLAKVGVSTDPKKEAEKKLTVKSVENKNKFSQAKLLAGAVKHRSSDGGNSVKRLKLDTDNDKNQERHLAFLSGAAQWVALQSTVPQRLCALVFSQAWAPTRGAAIPSPVQIAKALLTPLGRLSPQSFVATVSLMGHNLKSLHVNVAWKDSLCRGG
ncbi:PSME3-interacting protein isoform X1 [Dermochelys coriacea]|uniref:PSME3-interacting protein isoform X1 n=1 Tax=Dermochelys coriacea TaxID=27794 RepID=UPI0018E7547C|nr:PSME3-interacting protein isoform X1 [Dermochelys coriacea]XP_043350807.1 PSME3-interacting protein isoform X1 [Dermochelys coriacea]